jgi:hypothetical protein
MYGCICRYCGYLRRLCEVPPFVRSADFGCICSCEKPQMEDEVVYLLEDALVMLIQKLRLIFCSGFKYSKLA